MPPGENCSRPPGSIHSPPSARDLPASLFYRYRLTKHVLPPGAPLYSALSHKGYRLAVCSGQPGAIPEAVCNWFGILPNWFQTSTLSQASLFSIIMTQCKTTQSCLNQVNQHFRLVGTFVVNPLPLNLPSQSLYKIYNLTSYSIINKWSNLSQTEVIIQYHTNPSYVTPKFTTSIPLA